MNNIPRPVFFVGLVFMLGFSASVALAASEIPTISSVAPQLNNNYAALLSREPVNPNLSSSTDQKTNEFDGFGVRHPVIREKESNGPSQFSRYVLGVAGENLAVFGTEMFSNGQNFMRQSTGQVNDDYKIGPGDQLQIHGWGMVDIDMAVKVDRSGEIYLPKVGSVKVAGVKYGDLQAYLKSAIKRIFNNFELAVSLAQTRSVQIYVVGHVKNPGTYTMSAMDTLLNVLLVSGGPSNTGTLRNIQVKRAGKVVAKFDVYDMLLNGNRDKDITLNDGDVIYVPESGGMVAIRGDVKRPTIFELSGKDSINDVLTWAGGFSPAAYGKNIIVESNDGKKIATLAEGSAEDVASELKKDHAVPASIIRIFSPGAVPHAMRSEKEYISLSGEVANPGTYIIKKGESLKDFIERTGVVNETAYIYATSLTRDSVKNSQQASLNEAVDKFEREVESTAAQRLSGAVDKDIATNIQGEVERQRKVIAMMRSVKADGRIVLEMKDAAASVHDLPDIPLQDGDSVFIPRRPGTVNVIGAVLQQSSFIYKPKRGVFDYINQAGGVSAIGDKSEVYVARADGTIGNAGRFFTWNNLQINPGDSIVVPERIEKSSWMQSLKEWTTILYQFGLGAAGLKVLQN